LRDPERNDFTSDGFTITLFPAAKAGAIFFIAINKGWLKGYLAGRQPSDN